MRHEKRLSKRGLWFVVVTTCAISAFSAPALAGVAATVQQSATVQKSAVSRILTVSGVGEVLIKADSLRTSISIRARAASLQQARAEAAGKTRAVIQALEAMKLQSLEVRTVEITVNPITERAKQPGEHESPRIIGYEAESTLSVALKGVAPDKLRADGPRILDVALAAGANVVGGIDFFLSKPREAHRLALAASVQDAAKNAQVMAGAATVKLLGLQTLSSEGGYVFEYAQQSALSGADAAGAVGFPVEPGEIRVTANVTASFQFMK